MDLQRLQQMLSGMSGRGGAQPDAPAPDTAEKIQISSLSLLKMLKHGKKFADIIADFQLLSPYSSLATRSRWCPYGGHGLDVGAIY